MGVFLRIFYHTLSRHQKLSSDLITGVVALIADTDVDVDAVIGGSITTLKKVNRLLLLNKFEIFWGHLIRSKN